MINEYSAPLIEESKITNHPEVDPHNQQTFDYFSSQIRQTFMVYPEYLAHMQKNVQSRVIDFTIGHTNYHMYDGPYALTIETTRQLDESNAERWFVSLNATSDEILQVTHKIIDMPKLAPGEYMLGGTPKQLLAKSKTETESEKLLGEFLQTVGDQPNLRRYVA